jgi:hypothetical protein
VITTLPSPGSLDAIQLATADPFLTGVTGIVIHDAKPAAAATELDPPAVAPSWAGPGRRSGVRAGRSGRPGHQGIS